MTTSEAAWHGMYTRLGEVIGQDHAETMMGHLAELATKSDVAELRREMREDLRGINQRLDWMAELLVKQGRKELTIMATSMVSLTAIFSLVVMLIR